MSAAILKIMLNLIPPVAMQSSALPNMCMLIYINFGAVKFISWVTASFSSSQV